jgi:DNA-binding transcriptional ArsR family regulator
MPRCASAVGTGSMKMTKRKKTERVNEPGRFAYEGLERVLHEKARLGILTSLVTRPEGVLFTELKQLCALTDGNLSRHLEVLREAGLVEVWKGFENRRPQTLCRLSPEGRQRFVAYLEQLEQVVRDAMPRAARRTERIPDVPPGFQPA